MEKKKWSTPTVSGPFLIAENTKTETIHSKDERWPGKKKWATPTVSGPFAIGVATDIQRIINEGVTDYSKLENKVQV